MPILRLDGDATGAVRATADIEKGVKRVGKAFTEAAKEAKSLEREAAKIVLANEGPQERYLRQIDRLDVLFKKGKLSVQQYLAAIAGYAQQLPAAANAATMLADAERDVQKAMAMVAADLAKASQRTVMYSGDTDRAIRSAKQLATEEKKLAAAALQATAAINTTAVATQRSTGAAAASGMASYFRTLFGPTALIYTAIQALRDYNSEVANIGGELRADRSGLGKLMQLAATKPDPEAARQQYIAQSKEIWKSGATSTLGQAGSLVFQLESAGITDPQHQKKVSDLLSLGIIPDANRFAAGIAAIRSTHKDLTPNQILGMGIVAGVPSPGEASDVVAQAARASSMTSRLWKDPAFDLAATSILSREFTSPEMGQERLAQFAKQLAERGMQFDRTLAGKGPLDIVQRIGDRTKGGTDVNLLHEYLGGRMEAGQGLFTLYKNLPELRELTKQAAGGGEGVVDTALDLARSTPEIDTARQAIASANARAWALVPEVNTTQLLQAARDDQMQGRNPLGRALVSLGYWAGTALNTQAGEEVLLRRILSGAEYNEGINPLTMEAIRRHIEGIDSKTKTKIPSGKQE